MFMKDFMDESIALFNKDIHATVSLPEKRLHNISESSPIFYRQEAYILHSIVADILWVAKMVRPNIEPSISFLCTRVTKINVEDKSKMKCVLKFLK